MDKPAIVEVKQKGGGASQPEERGGTPVAEEQQKEAGELETKKNPWQPDEGLSELEQSVLEGNAQTRRNHARRRKKDS